MRSATARTSRSPPTTGPRAAPTTAAPRSSSSSDDALPGLDAQGRRRRLDHLTLVLDLLHAARAARDIDRALPLAFGLHIAVQGHHAVHCRDANVSVPERVVPLIPGRYVRGDCVIGDGTLCLLARHLQLIVDTRHALGARDAHGLGAFRGGVHRSGARRCTMTDPA